MNLVLLWQQVQSTQAVIPSIPAAEHLLIAGTLRTAAFGWLSSMIDPHPAALNVFPLWRLFFPHRGADVNRVEAALQPYQTLLHTFRSEVAFHANKSLARHGRARQGVLNPALTQVTLDFLDLAQSLLGEEARVPGLSQHLASNGF